MILELEKGSIKVLQDSCENTDSALIHLKFKDINLTSKTKVMFMIDEKPLTEIRQDVWKLNQSIHRGKENLVVIGVIQNGITKIYKSNFLIETYVSFGKLGVEKLPQVILDLNQRIEELSEEIKKINNKMNAI